MRKSKEYAEECLKKLSDEEWDKLGVERLADIPNVKYTSTGSNKDFARYTYKHIYIYMLVGQIYMVLIILISSFIYFYRTNSYVIAFQFQVKVLVAAKGKEVDRSPCHIGGSHTIHT